MHLIMHKRSGHKFVREFSRVEHTLRSVPKNKCGKWIVLLVDIITILRSVVAKRRNLPGSASVLDKSCSCKGRTESYEVPCDKAFPLSAFSEISTPWFETLLGVAASRVTAGYFTS